MRLMNDAQDQTIQAPMTPKPKAAGISSLPAAPKPAAMPTLGPVGGPAPAGTSDPTNSGVVPFTGPMANQTIAAPTGGSSPVPAAPLPSGAPLAQPYVAGSGVNPANPNATATNPFEGMKSAEGGGFGGYDTAVDPSTGLTLKQYDEKVAAAKKSMAPIDWSKVTRRSNVGGVNLSADDARRVMDETAALERRLAAGESLTDDERSLLIDQTENPFRSAADALRMGIDTRGNKIDQTLDYYDRAAAAGAMTPEQATYWRNKAVQDKALQEQGQAPSDVDKANVPQSPMTANGFVTPNGVGSVTGGTQGVKRGGTVVTSTANNIPGVGSVGGGGLTTPTSTGGVGGMGNVDRTATDPKTALTTQTLSRVPGADRFKLALQGVQDWETSTRPGFEADVRDATRQAAGRGQTGSNILRGRYGDVTANRDLQRNAVTNQYLRDALTGSIDDSFRDVGVAQDQQKFQQGQQESAFEQALRQALGEDTLTNSAFRRAQDQSEFGSRGNPGGTQMDLAEFYRQLAGGATKSAGTAGATAGSGGSNAYIDLIRKLLNQYGGGGAPASTGDYPDLVPSGVA